jgi:hypothetical protein
VTAPRGPQSLPNGNPPQVEAALGQLERWTRTQLAAEVRRAYERGRAHTFGALILGLLVGSATGFVLGLLFS